MAYQTTRSGKFSGRIFLGFDGGAVIERSLFREKQ